MPSSLGTPANKIIINIIHALMWSLHRCRSGYPGDGEKGHITLCACVCVKCNTIIFLEIHVQIHEAGYEHAVRPV